MVIATGRTSKPTNPQTIAVYRGVRYWYWCRWGGVPTTFTWMCRGSEGNTNQSDRATEGPRATPTERERDNIYTHTHRHRYVCYKIWLLYKQGFANVSFASLSLSLFLSPYTAVPMHPRMPYALMCANKPFWINHNYHRDTRESWRVCC